MRIIVFFDLPTETPEDKREYQSFRKYLIRSGFIMMQESVYFKIVLNLTAADAACENIKKHKPRDGLVQMLLITERQFEKMQTVTGKPDKTVVDSSERLVVL